MAKDKTPKSKSTKADTKANDTKKSVSMRESAAKSREKAGKPKRVRRAAEAAGKPLSKTAEFMTKQRHVFPKSGSESFIHRERSASPKWFVNAWAELRQVKWPNRKDTWRLVLAVFVFSAVLSTVIALLDNGLEAIFKRVFL